MCLFCKIINNEIPSYKIYEDDEFVAFLDISQATIGHTLVVPKRHYANIFELDDQTSKNLFLVVKKIALLLKEKLSIEAINVVNNNGKLAGQTIDHFHIHLIPRYPNDDFAINQVSHNVSSEDLASICNKITK